LTQSRQGEAAKIEDQRLLDHLAHCPDCAREARAVGTLGQMLQAASADDTGEMAPLPAQRDAVEARVAELDGSRKRKKQRLAARKYGLWRRPAYTAGLAAVAVALVMVSLVPFGYYRTVGYDVALGGVNKDLALDDERMCDVLFDIGLIEAIIDVTDCDTTCNLLIYDLKSAEEVQLVVAVFDGLSSEEVTTNVTPVVTRTSGSLFERANEQVVTGQRREVRADDFL
jgi:hypothetical protein